jgi:hypothetical protein
MAPMKTHRLTSVQSGTLVTRKKWTLGAWAPSLKFRDCEGIYRRRPATGGGCARRTVSGCEEETYGVAPLGPMRRALERRAH